MDRVGTHGTSDGGEQSGHADHLLVAVKNMVISLFEQGRVSHNALALHSRALWFANHIIQLFESEEPSLEPLACEAGCHYCCFYQVWLTPPEALLVGHHMENIYTDKQKQDLIRRIEKTLKITDGKNAEERAKTWHDTPCIFLTSGRCSVYECRPLVCAALHSLNGDQCKEAFESSSRLAEIEGHAHRYHIFQTVKRGLVEVSMDMGCQMESLPIAHAMKQYLEHPSPTEAWIKGDKVFR